MTTAESSGSDRQWIWDLIAHLQPLIWWFSAGSAVVTAIVPDLVGSWAAWTISLSLLLAIVAGIKHQRSLCARCAAATPLNTEAAVEKDGRWLRMFHWLYEHSRLASWGLVGLIAAEVVVSGGLGQAVGALVNVLLGLQVFLGLKHRVLAPWCPWCHWGGGGDDEVAPEPAPPPSIVADR